MNLLSFVLLAVQIHSVAPVIHSLQYFRTVSSQVPNFPDYVVVGYVDEVEIGHYDSNNRKAEVKLDWMNKITAEDPQHLKILTELSIFRQDFYKKRLETLQQRFNQTGGVHIYQKMSGCEWNTETDEVRGWDQESYDGEDFITLDMNTWTFTAAKPQAIPSKHEWDHDSVYMDSLKYYYTEICPYYLKKYVKLGRNFLMRTELPKVSLLQKTPSSPVSCHATGFYPNIAALFWRKDGEELHEGVEHGEMLPNHDGTFQMTVDLTVKVTDDMEDNLSITATVAAPAVVALLGAIIIIIVKCYKKRHAKYDPAARDGGGELSEKMAVEG
ncbi:class I histocompatibility antigen, F10 alpha chain-like isoform X2 [Dunckerocampus dactyliophorus]|uniref:class I histocompatibility antigen, F10 alpha chain-like isoform X2 n=1 Tax=Dunckerocampus dactyliophorus TaxID=161453 RepID=UPI002406D594|nr:class I histocompatibility antigen, F10 alpha chain-like isoform X2 [Dunckerocampus dactyliophorus]